MKTQKPFRTDTSGSTAILASLCLLAIMGFAAVAVDASSLYFQKRRQQSASDLAAMAAAGAQVSGQQAAFATLALNGFDSTSLQTIEQGIYVADPAIAASQRFTPALSGATNAARVTVVTHPRTIFGQLLSNGFSNSSATAFPGVATITTQATAAQNALASFAIGSRLAQVNGGVLNGLLGGLLGGNLSLSVMDYQSLASAQIDLFAFSNALAVQANMTGVTYGQLAQGSFRVGDVLNAIASAGNGNPQIATALAQIANSPTSPATMMGISSLISFGPYAQSTVGGAPPVAMSVSALDLVSAVAQIANGTHQIQMAMNANISGLAAVTLQLAIGERPVGTSFVAIGSQGASVHTAQTRLLLNVQLVASGQTALVNLPIYIELASGTAQLSSVQCSPSNVALSSATLAVTPSIIDAWIGAVSNADFTNFISKPNPGPATLLDVAGLATVTARAEATMTNLSPTPVTFTYSDIIAATKKTTSTTDFVSSLLSNLVGNLQLNVNALGLGIGLPSTLTQTVGQTLAAATTPIDQLVTSLLNTLGVGLGQADTWVSGVKCGSAVLVN